jgi:hypothetical protein
MKRFFWITIAFGVIGPPAGFIGLFLFTGIFEFVLQIIELLSGPILVGVPRHHLRMPELDSVQIFLFIRYSLPLFIAFGYLGGGLQALATGLFCGAWYGHFRTFPWYVPAVAGTLASIGFFAVVPLECRSCGTPSGISNYDFHSLVFNLLGVPFIHVFAAMLVWALWLCLESFLSARNDRFGAAV